MDLAVGLEPTLPRTPPRVDATAGRAEDLGARWAGTLMTCCEVLVGFLIRTSW